jgi:hypothetical protein
MPSDLIRGWIPVRVKKTRQNKNRCSSAKVRAVNGRASLDALSDK